MIVPVSAFKFSSKTRDAIFQMGFRIGMSSCISTPCEQEPVTVAMVFPLYWAYLVESRYYFRWLQEKCTEAATMLSEQWTVQETTNKK